MLVIFKLIKVSDQFGIEIIVKLIYLKNLNDKDVKDLKDLFHENHLIVLESKIYLMKSNYLLPKILESWKFIQKRIKQKIH